MPSKHTKSKLLLLTSSLLAVLLSCCGRSSGAVIFPITYIPSTGISPTTACSRTSGNAPLGIVVNAVGTVSTHTSPASDSTAGFHQILYTWTFGDAGAGTWTYGSGGGTASRNTAYGPVAAHVFDTPGTYAVQVTINDGTATSTVTACTVTVNSWPSDTTTTCVSSATLPVAGADGCPSGAAVAEVNTGNEIDTVISTYSGNNKRILLKHDDTFTGSSSGPVMGCSSCEVNMYGTGAKPILSGTVIQLGTASATLSDMRLVNIDSENSTSTSAAINIFAFPHGTISDTLIYSSKFANCSGSGQDAIAASVTVDGPFKRTMVVNNVFDHCANMNAGTGGEGLYMEGEDQVVMGNDIIANGALQQHPFRTMYTQRGTINNNSWSNAPSNKEWIAIRGLLQPTDSEQPYCNNNCPTQYIVVSDNDLNMNAGVTGIRPGPSNSSYTSNIIQDIIIERNYIHQAVSGTAAGALEIHANDVTIRDNVLDCTGACTNQAVSITGNYAPFPSNVWVYNNTLYNGTGSTGNIVLYSSVSNVTLENNLGYAPSGTTFISTGGCTGGCVTSNNSSNVQYTGTNPNWAGAGTYTSISSFKPNAGSYAINAGASIPVWDDALGVAWSGAYDYGAVKH